LKRLAALLEPTRRAGRLRWPASRSAAGRPDRHGGHL